MEAKKLGKEVQVTFISGSTVEDGKTEQRYTVSCDCGGRVHAARKESSIEYLVKHEKYRGPCCGSRYHMSGLKTFNGSTIVEDVTEVPQITEETAEIAAPVEAITEVQVEAPAQAEPETTQPAAQNKPEPRVYDTCGGLLVPGRKGITNAQMIPGIRKAIESGEDVQGKLTLLANAYPEVFESSAKYVPDNMKVVLEAFLKAYKNDDSFELPIGKKLRAAGN